MRAIVGVAMCSFLGWAGTVDAHVTSRASVSTAGVEGNGVSGGASVSADGRFVAFHSAASTLTAGDTNGVQDVFVRDRLSGGATVRVSVSSAGVESDGASESPSISADGRLIAFASLSTNLVVGDTNGTSDVFVHDRQTGLTVRVSRSSAGAQGNGFSSDVSISADGRTVVFSSNATNLVAGDTNGRVDVFVHDLLTGQTTRASVDSTGAQGNGASVEPSISADGRVVAFKSGATNLAPGATVNQVYVHDRQSGTTELASRSTGGVPGNSLSERPAISGDGRIVAYHSFSSNLVPGDTNGSADVFVLDRLIGVTSRVSVSTAGAQGSGSSLTPAVSSDGRHIAFDSAAGTLVAGDTNGVRDGFVHDRTLGITTRVSLSSQGAQGNGVSDYVSISADGRVFAFESVASNLVAGDSNGVQDVFLHDRRCAGDANGDGTVDFLDLNHVLADFGLVGPGLAGDLDGDGDCDFADLNIVLAHFGASC